MLGNMFAQYSLISDDAKHYACRPPDVWALWHAFTSCDRRAFLSSKSTSVKDRSDLVVIINDMHNIIQ